MSQLHAPCPLFDSPSMTTEIPLELIQRLPKTDLHCHLDGSLRLDTILDLARKQQVKLPTFDRGELFNMLYAGEHVASLDDYLRAFDITLSVMQTEEGLERTAYESSRVHRIDSRAQYCEEIVSKVGSGGNQCTCRGSDQAESPVTTSNCRRSLPTTWSASASAHNRSSSDMTFTRACSMSRIACSE